MNELNINIEGYNVNGICVGCLNYNRKMYHSDHISDYFKKLGDIEVPVGLFIQVCWECHAAIRSIHRFQMQIQKSYEHLIEYSNKYPVLNYPEDLSKHAIQRLTSVVTSEPLAKIDFDAPQESPETVAPKLDDVEIKREPDVDIPFEEVNFDIDNSKPAVKDEVSFDNDDFLNDYMSDDDDVKLVTLKKKKEKKRKKSKDGSDRERKALQSLNFRKLKNFPENTVELFDITEDEMFEIRKADRARVEYVDARYKCENCILSFTTEKLLSSHIERKHKKNQKHNEQCDVCKICFPSKENLETHRLSHLVGYRCKSCSYITGVKKIMTRHISSVHRDDKTDLYRCKLCKKKFSTKSKLTYHRAVSHQEKPQCDCCGKIFANKITLKYHLKILPLDKAEKKKEKLNLQCYGCSKVFHSRKSYRAHVVIHDGLEYPCPVCGKLFQWKRNLARHIRNHKERETGMIYSCKECGKRFSSKDCYSNHMKFSKKHVSEETFVHECSYCLKRFPTKWCMIDHIDWDHLKKIKYQCSVCMKPFKTAKIMVAHMNNLHEEKKNREPDGEHLCEVCGKSYKTVKRLKGHVWAMHTHRSTVKSFKCKLCPATFTWQTSIYKHMKMMHENKRIKQSRVGSEKKRDHRLVLPYDELTNRIQYFQQNISVNIDTPNI